MCPCCSRCCCALQIALAGNCVYEQTGQGSTQETRHKTQGEQQAARQQTLPRCHRQARSNCHPHPLTHPPSLRLRLLLLVSNALCHNLLTLLCLCSSTLGHYFYAINPTWVWPAAKRTKREEERRRGRRERGQWEWPLAIAFAIIKRIIIWNLL